MLVNTGANDPDLEGVGKPLLNAFPLASQDMPPFLKYTKDELHAKHPAVIYVNNATGIGAAKLYQEAAKKEGIPVVAAESVEPGAVDASSVVAKVLAKNPDVVHVVALSEGGVVFKALKTAGFSGKVTSYAGTAERTDVRTTAGDAINGVQYYSYTGKPNKEFNDLFDRFTKTYGHAPAAASYLPYVYGAPLMIAAAVKKLRADGKTHFTGADIYDEILKIKTFELPGLGKAVFDSKGMVKMPLYVKQISKWNNATTVDSLVKDLG
jgi:ABC-type branched-chain amino acid transport systems, periplasmic component